MRGVFVRLPIAQLLAVVCLTWVGTARAQNATGPSPGDPVSFNSGSFSGPVTSAGAVSAPLFDGGTATLSSATLTGANGATCVSFQTSGCRLYVGTGVNDYFDTPNPSGGTIKAHTDFQGLGYVAADAVNGGFRSISGAAALLQGFPSAGTGVRLNAGTALGGTAGDLLMQVENAAVAKAAVVPSGAYVVLGGLPEKTGTYFPAETTSTAFTAVGLPSPTLLAGTPTASNADAAYQMILFTTGGSSGDAAGYSGPFTTTRITHLPRVYNAVRTDASAVTSTYLVFGFSASGLEGLTTLAGANGIRGCWFRFDTGLSDATWQAVSSDGTTASATDTTISVAAATTYLLMVDAAIAAGTCRYYVNGVLKVSKATNIPAGSTALGLGGFAVTRTNSARTVNIARTRLEQL